MGESVKELRQRIGGVTNIQKITRAMEMVATTKLRRLQNRAEGTRPYADTIRRLSASLASSMPDGASPLTDRRESVSRVAILGMSSDRGLCGSFNSNVLRRLRNQVDEFEGKERDLYLVGKKARQGLGSHPDLKQAFEDEVEKLEFSQARGIAEQLSREFLKGGADGGVDEVWVVYTRFVSMTKQMPVAEKFLPIESGEEAEGSGGGVAEGAILEPSPEVLLEQLLPKSLAVRMYAAMLDSLASEFAARRMAMKQATDAAGEMIQDLRRRYNRARQEGITKELLDIVGGAEAAAS